MGDGEVRRVGTVIAVHPSANRYGGTYGEIACDDGKHYVFSGANVFRNFSQAVMGARVSFEVVCYSYATNIDQLDKHRA